MNSKTLATIVAATFTLGACGGGDDEAARDAAEQEEMQAQQLQRDSDGPENLEQALNQMAQAFGAGGDGKKVETVSARTLKGMLPEKLGKMPRASFSAQKNGAMGFNVTTAEATYNGDDGATITLEISDIGAMQGIASLGMNWMNMEIDEESDKGFRRSLEYKGHRAFQNYSTAGGRPEGDMAIFVNGRFVVKVIGRDVPFEQIEKAVEMLPIDEFEKLSRTTGNDGA